MDDFWSKKSDVFSMWFLCDLLQNLARLLHGKIIQKTSYFQLNIFWTKITWNFFIGQTNEFTLFYHTTNWYSAESIITGGINFGECRRRQDFSSKIVSYYLNNNFNCAIEFGQQWCLNTCAIVVYCIPANLLERYDHLDLSKNNKMWKDVVHRSCNGVVNIVDDYDSAYDPQVTNDTRLLNDPRMTPQASATLSCLNYLLE